MHNMLLEITNKVLIVLLCLSCLNVIRHLYFFIQTWFISTDIEPIKYKLSKTGLLYLGLSVSYIISSIFSGVKI